MKRATILLLSLCISMLALGQTTASIVDQVNLDSLTKTVREFSGEDSTVVNDSTVLIDHRVSNWGNNLAADYLVERFERLGLDVMEHNYRAKGRNILATIEGKTNPDNIYIICAHYDAVTNYCADDNASGTAAILEAARLLSTQCLDNTVIFALWDEEELGLIGAKYYATLAKNRGDNILAVLNMDMLAYDSDSNFVFDIHTRSSAQNQAIKDTLIYLVDTLNLPLVPNVINPGTNRSDHAAFWQKGYPAVFFGESFLGGDPTPFYHSKGDRINTFNMPYFFELSKLAVGVITEYAGVIPADQTFKKVQVCEQYVYKGDTLFESGIYRDTNSNLLGCDSIHSLDLTVIHLNDSVERNDRVLTSADTTARYQWLDCNDPFNILFADTMRSYTVNEDGSYAVQITKEGCRDTSVCFELMVSGVADLGPLDFKVYPNPSEGEVTVEWSKQKGKVNFMVFDATGRLIDRQTLYSSGHHQLHLYLSSGFYTLVMETPDGLSRRKLRVL